MALIRGNYKKAIIEELVASITANTSRYYAFAAGPAPYSGAVPDDIDNVANTSAIFAWNMIFGKRIANTDIIPVIRNITWTTNTVYDRYDDLDTALANSDFYVIVTPSIVGGDYTIFKCIDNANGVASVDKPDQIQATTFEKSDGYKWRYITSVPTSTYNKFSTTNYFPIVANSSIAASALENSSVDVVVVDNGGMGYSCYNSGSIRSIVNTTYMQIESNASPYADFYTQSGIYIYNPEGDPAGQIFQITAYEIVGNTRYVALDHAANTSLYVAGVTEYQIAPYVKFETDGTTPKAYCSINTTANSILSVTVIDPGSDITRCTTTIVSNTSYGSGANVRSIIPPSGGHGANPIVELGCQGMSLSFSFSNTESNTIPTNIQFNKVGIMRNPYILNANNTKGGAFSTNTFSQVLKANVSPSATFTVGDTVTGATSGAVGIVAFSNSTVLYLTGDKHFSNNETITGTSNTTDITITTLGAVWQKEIQALYYQNANNIARSNTQNEQFRVILKI